VTVTGVRGPALAAGLALVVFFVLLVSATHLVPWAESFDLAVHTWMIGHRTDAVVGLAIGVTTGGSSAVTAPVVFLFALAVTAGPLRARAKRAAIVLAVLGAAILCRYGLAELIARARPPHQDWAAYASGQAFPSGHTSDAALAAGLIGWLVSQRLGDRPMLHRLTWIVAGLSVIAVATTRVYLGMHWPTDVLGAIAFATAWLAVALVVERAGFAVRRGDFPR
jgi:membrane-associated phospholipid phosphatase